MVAPHIGVVSYEYGPFLSATVASLFAFGQHLARLVPGLEGPGFPSSPIQPHRRWSRTRAREGESGREAGSNPCRAIEFVNTASTVQLAACAVLVWRHRKSVLAYQGGQAPSELMLHLVHRLSSFANTDWRTIKRPLFVMHMQS